jgi:ferritin-like metal-binding protein YciE
MEAQDEIRRKFIEHLEHLWTMENHILELLPAIIEKVYDGGLKNILRLHYAETLNQTSGLRGIFKQLDLDVRNRNTDHFGSILDRTNDSIRADDTSNSMDNDQLIISFCDEIETYEIEQYTSAADQAFRLGFIGVHKTLLSILMEEKMAKVKLAFAEKNINDGQSKTLEEQMHHTPL